MRVAYTPRGLPGGAFQLHQFFLKFFRDGAMLGETAVRRIVYLPERPETTFDGNRLVWAWGSASRVPCPFDDIVTLVAAIRKDNAQLEAAPPQIVDFISRPVDREALKYKPADPAPFFRNEVAVYRQVPHMVWQYGAGDAREILYAFANIGNTDSRVEFLYGARLYKRPIIHACNIVLYVKQSPTECRRTVSYL